MQSVPLAVVALASVSFLLWAHNVAASRVLPPTNTVITNPEDGQMLDAPPSSTVVDQPANAVPSAPGAQPPTVTNVPASSAPTGPNVPDTSAPVGTPPVAQTNIRNGRTTPSQRIASAPRQPPGVPRPQPTQSPFIGIGRPGGTQIAPAVPTARIPTPASSTPARGTTARPAGGSTGGSPLIASGTKSRGGYIRITGNPPTAATRPEARSRDAETASREDAAAGHTSSAIAGATSAIASGRDTGWRYQQRALLFLERGDNARAIDDFRTAIAAYRDQINRNVNVDQARAGIDACQNGLRLAQLQMR
jgi:hypothetical protein